MQGIAFLFRIDLNCTACTNQYRAAEKMMRLSEMDMRSKGVIVHIEGKELEIALLGLGLVVGDLFEVSAQAPFGGPIALRLPGAKIALRKADAYHVLVNLN